MEWQDKGILLSTKRLGENKLLAIFLTELHGKQSGVFTAHTSPHLFTPLAHVVQLQWRGRNPEQLGQMKIEPLSTFKATSSLYTSYLLKSALTSLLQSFLLAHDPHPALFQETVTYLKENPADKETQLRHYFTWEVALLKELGFGINLPDLEAPIEVLAEQNHTYLKAMADQLGKNLPNARGNLLAMLPQQDKMSA